MSDASSKEKGPGLVAPEIRDLEDLAQRLGGWLSRRMPGASDIMLTDLRYPLGAGMSHETILFDARWTEEGRARQQGLVIRIKPTKRLVYQDDMFAEQYRLMALMHEAGHVRVAKPIWFEDSDELLGAPFFVMEKVAGRVAVSYPPYSKEGWLVEATADQRRRMWHEAVTQLASIQKVSVDDAPFLHLPGAFAENFDEETDRWRRFMEALDPAGEQPLLRQAFDRLLEARPDNRPEGIVWGDARLGNMMIGDDYSVVAVMDWEQPSLGGALHDLGWWLHSDDIQTRMQNIEPLAGMGTREETIALWEQVSGKSAADIDWYEAFAVFKMECLQLRMQSWNQAAARAAGTTPGTRTLHHLDR